MACVLRSRSGTCLVARPVGRSGCRAVAFVMTNGALQIDRSGQVERPNRGCRRAAEVLIWIVPEIVWNSASDSSPHRIPKKFRCGHWTKSYCTVDDESVVIFFDNIEAFQLVTLNFSLPSQ